MPASDPVPDLLRFAEALGQAVGGLGVLIALIALVVELRRARRQRRADAEQAEAERHRFERQIEALQQAENERLAAQARKVIFTVINASALLPNLYHVRIDNVGYEIVSGLEVQVYAQDEGHNVVANGCQIADRNTVGEAFAGIMTTEIAKTFAEIKTQTRDYLNEVKTGAIDLGQGEQQMEALFAQLYGYMDQAMTIDDNKAQILREQVQQETAARLHPSWPEGLAPGQFAMMPYLTTHANYSVCVDMQFDDPNYRWRRINGAKPEIVSEFVKKREPEVSTESKVCKWYTPTTWRQRTAPPPPKIAQH